MKHTNGKNPIGRREFMKRSTVAAVGGAALAGASSSDGADTPVRNQQETMTYRKLGRTNIVSSRLVFGCGAALAGGKAVRLLDRALEAGINHYDVGSNIYYKGSEASLAPFMKAHRDDIWVLSKAPARAGVKPNEPVTVEQAQGAAKSWSRLLDQSLKDLDTDHVDAYYLMAVRNPYLISSEEMYQAFWAAKEAGKVDYFGLSCHQNAQKVLEAAIKTGWYDLAMIGVTPGGWYDWTTKDLVKDTPPLLKLQPLLKRAREAGIGLVGLKTVRHLSMGAPETLFDPHYDEAFLNSGLNAFQRAYAYALAHGLDVVNADMQNFKHLEENVIAAASVKTLIA